MSNNPAFLINAWISCNCDGTYLLSFSWKNKIQDRKWLTVLWSQQQVDSRNDRSATRAVMVSSGGILKSWDARTCRSRPEENTESCTCTISIYRPELWKSTRKKIISGDYFTTIHTVPEGKLMSCSWWEGAGISRGFSWCHPVSSAPLSFCTYCANSSTQMWAQ